MFSGAVVATNYYVQIAYTDADPVGRHAVRVSKIMYIEIVAQTQSNHHLKYDMILQVIRKYFIFTISTLFNPTSRGWPNPTTVRPPGSAHTEFRTALANEDEWA